MAKRDWNALRAEFASSNLSISEFAELKGINYNTARRQLKASDRKSDHSSDRESDHKSDRKSDHSKKSVPKKAKADHADTNTPPPPEAKRHGEGRDRSGRFAAGNPGNPNPPANAFPVGNGAALKHSGYSRRFNDEVAYEDASEVWIQDEMLMCRARIMRCMDVHAQVKADLAKAGSVEARMKLYELMISTEQAADRNIARVESLTLTMARTRKLNLESDRLSAEAAGLGTDFGDIVAEIQEMGSDGLMSTDAHE